MNMPQISIEAVNQASVTVGDVTVWFSYKTPIAFQIAGNARVVRQNDWSVTTGKHLNAIDGGDKASRVSGEEFERLWTEQMNQLEQIPS